MITLALVLTAASPNVANAAKRVALVIGNAKYENAPVLKNPRNDAEDLAKKLRNLGFVVVSGFDLDARDMRDKVREFGNKLRGSDVAMFFYAGHALQVNGRNYLAPVNTNIRHEGDLDFETIPMDFIERQMENETKTVLLFLDACRNNPLARNLTRTRSASTRGLARETNSTEGTFIAFSTQPNNVAQDGEGRNSPFTAALLSNIERPNVEISVLMTDVREQVYKTTHKEQIPWINSSLLGRFYFKKTKTGVRKTAALDTDNSNPSDAANSTSPANPAIISQPSAKADKLLEMRVELLAWESVKDGNDADELRAFIKLYGSGFFGDLARLRLKKLQAKSDKSQAAPQVANIAPATRPTLSNPPKKDIVVANLDTADNNRKIEVEKALKDDAAPPQVKVVTREITRQIQSELNRLGCDAGGADGLWGAKSMNAVAQYQKFAKIHLSSLQPSFKLLDRLQKHNARICPLTCRAGFKESGGACVKIKRQAKINTKTPVRTKRKKVSKKATVVRRTVQPAPVQQPTRRRVSNLPFDVDAQDGANTNAKISTRRRNVRKPAIVRKSTRRRVIRRSNLPFDVDAQDGANTNTN